MCAKFSVTFTRREQFKQFVVQDVKGACRDVVCPLPDPGPVQGLYGGHIDAYLTISYLKAVSVYVM